MADSASRPAEIYGTRHTSVSTPRRSGAAFSLAKVIKESFLTFEDNATVALTNERSLKSAARNLLRLRFFMTFGTAMTMLNSFHKFS